MADYAGWYPPGQVCYPPELPAYLKGVHDLKPITGVPSDEEVIEIHAVIQVANRASTIPGMSNPELLMELGDHLFSAQMGKQIHNPAVPKRRYIYAPNPHVSVNLEPISRAPSDEQVSKVQEAIRLYQKYSEIPSMFETRVNAELSQHLFDIQMARYMTRAAQRQPSRMPRGPTPLPTPARTIEPVTGLVEGPATHETTNNARIGAGVVESRQSPEIGIREILERSNQLAERANQLSERSNQLIERCNQITEQSNQPNSPSEQFNELIGRLNQHFGRSNQLIEECKKPVEQLGDILKATNKVLVGIQHAIIRNHAGNTYRAVNCLINEKGDIPPDSMDISWRSNMDEQHRIYYNLSERCGNAYLTEDRAVTFLQFYGIGDDLFEDCEKTRLRKDDVGTARSRISHFLSSALGS